jgi:uroporphyrinogen-III synthase
MNDILTLAGAVVDTAHVYTLAEPESDFSKDNFVFTNSVSSSHVSELIHADRIDWILFASPTAAKNFFKHVIPDTVKNSTARIASIGPVTTNTICQYNIEPDIEAVNHTLDDLLDELERARQ